MLPVVGRAGNSVAKGTKPSPSATLPTVQLTTNSSSSDDGSTRCATPPTLQRQSTNGELMSDSRCERMQLYESFKDLQELCRDNGITPSQFAKRAMDTVTTLDMFMGFWPSMKSIMYFPALRELSITKHPTITKIEGLSVCVHLELLCITECGVERIEDLENCTRLRQLNLSSNKLRTIEQLDSLEQLQVLWLNDNRIETLTNLWLLKKLTTLWICRNRIERIDAALSGCTSLTELNIADNRISSFKSLLSLANLDHLTTLTLNDPHYGDNPVCRLCNYQTYVLCQLNRLRWLDTIEVSSRTKLIAEATMIKKKMYYNMRIKALQRDVQHRFDQIERIRLLSYQQLETNISALMQHKKELEKMASDLPITSTQSSTMTRKLEAIESCLVEKCSVISCLHQEYETLCTRLQWSSDRNISSLLLELETGGNIRLEDGSPSDLWYGSCVDLVKSRLFASDLRVFGISDIQIHRVTRITNRYLRNRFHARVEEILVVNDTQVKENVSKKGVTVSSKGKEEDSDQEEEEDEDTETNTGASSYQKRQQRAAAAKATSVSSVPDNSLEYLFYVQPPLLDDVQCGTTHLEQFHAAENGFRAPEAYRTMGLDSAIRLSNSVALLDTSRLLAAYAAKGKNGLTRQDVAHFSTLSVQKQDQYVWTREIRESAKLVSNGEWELPPNVLLVVKVFPGYTKVLADTEEVLSPVENQKYPGLHSVQSTKVTNASKTNSLLSSIGSVATASTGTGTEAVDATKQKMYYLFDKTLVLPEYIVEYEYVSTTSAIKNLGPKTTAEPTPALTASLSNGLGSEEDIGNLGACIRLAEEFERKYRVRRSESDPVTSRSPLSPSTTHRHATTLDEKVVMVLEMEPVPKTIATTPELPLLQRIQHAQTTQLTHLNMYACALESIPDLQAVQPYLKTLILSNNRLSSIDANVRVLTSLTHLDLSHNQLSTLDHLDPLTTLSRLDLNHNQIVRFETIEYLGRIRKDSLRHVDLRKNGICDTKRYRLHVLQHLKQLNVLDQQTVRREEVTMTERLLTQLSPLIIWKRFQSTHMMYTPSTTSNSRTLLNAQSEDVPCFTAVEQVIMNRELIHTLEGLEPFVNLRVAMFQDNMITCLQGLERCTRLEELSLEDNLITKVEHLDTLVCLKRLSLARNQLCGSIEHLHGLENLTQLSLEDNQITSLQGLGGAMKLMELYMANNCIEVLKEVQHLKALPKLTILDLSGNPLTQLSDYRIYTVYYLRRIKILDGTSISIQDQSDAKQKYSGKLTLEFIIEKYGNSTTSPRGLGTLERIQELDLSSCRIRELGLISGKQFPVLRELNLENNQISDIMGLESFPELRILNLNRNRIERLLSTSEISGSKGILACFKLEQLFVAYNAVTDMTTLGLQYLEALQVLHLQGNSINLFAGLDSNTELVELRLDHNKIRQVDAHPTAAFRKLKVLSLDDNGLKSLGNFSMFPTLEYLDVSNNRLTDLDELDKLGLMPSLFEIRLVNNPMTKKHLYRQNVLYRFLTLRNIDGRDVMAEERERVEMLFAQERNASLLTLERPALHNRDPLTITPSTIPATKVQYSHTNTTSNQSAGGVTMMIMTSSGARTVMPQLSAGEVLIGSLPSKNPNVPAVLIPNQQPVQSVHTFTKSDPLTGIALSNTTTKSLLSSTAYRNQVMSNSNQTTNSTTVASPVGSSLLNTGGDNFNVNAPLQSERRRMSSIQYCASVLGPTQQQGPFANGNTNTIPSSQRTGPAATTIIHPLSADVPHKIIHSKSGTASTTTTASTSTSNNNTNAAFSGYVVSFGNQKRYTSLQDPANMSAGGVHKNVSNGRPRVG